MSSLGSLYYTLGIRDLTDADFQRINAKLKNAGTDLRITPRLGKDINDILPRGLKLELEPKLKELTNEALARAVEGKVMRIEVLPLLTQMRKALRDATKDNPPQIEMGVQEGKLRSIIQRVLNKQGFMLNISTVNDNYSKVVQQKLNGTTYKVRIHADAREIARSVQASLMQVQSRTFGLKVSRDILYRSIDEALGQKKFPITVYVNRENARNAVQTALNKAAGMSTQDILNYKRLADADKSIAKTKALEAANYGAANAAKAHASASINLGGALGSNIKIAGELGSAMASLYSIHAAKQFLSQVVEIGGELEHQKIAMDTIFGDKGKTGELFGQIKGLARQSPFGVMELTKSVKALSAYGVQYNEIYDTAKRLADISAATSVDINRLILAFGKTRSRGFLDGLEAKQFAYANIPIYEMVRKKLEELEGQAVTTADVMKHMKKREIGFDIVKDVLWDMTDPGGKFHNMQQALAGSVKTSWKLVRDNIELMFGEVADSWVGGGLKEVAQLLQGLTREWRTLGSAIGAGAIAFGVYKVAVLAHNVVAGKSISLAAKQHASLKMARHHANLAAVSYRQLTQAEIDDYLASSGLAKIKGINALRSKQLTSSEADSLLTKKLLKQEDILRLVALRKLSAAEAEAVLVTNSMTAADAAETKAQIARAAAAKRSAVIIGQVKAAAAGVVSSLWAFAKSAAPLAALGALVSLWQRNSEEMDKAKEIGDGIFTKATEGADNLRKTLDDIKPSEGLTDHQLDQGIEQMQQAIKDYSPTPINDINDALYTQEGLLRPLAQRYDELKKKLEGIKASFDAIEQGGIGGVVQNAIDFTNGGWFNDDINTNAKDYDKALKEQSAAITKYIVENARAARAAVKEALDLSPEFEAATKGMKWQQQFDHLVRNRDKYAKAFTNPNGRASVVADVDMSLDISRAHTALMDDMQRLWDYIEADAAKNGADAVENATEEVKRGYAISIRSWIQGLEVSDEVKQMMFNFYANLLKFDFEEFNAQGMIVDALDKGLEAEVGKEIFQKVKNGLSLDPDDQQAFNTALQKLYAKLFESIPKEQKAALNNAISSIGEDGMPHYDAGKMLSIQAQLNVRADWAQWQREIDDATGNLKPIQAWVKGAADIPSFVKAVQEGYQEAQKGLDQLKPLMIKAGIEFNSGEELPEGSPSEWFTALPDAQKELVRQYNEYVRTLNAGKTAAEAYGFNPDADKNKDGDKAERDLFGGAVKERIDLLRKAKSEYEALSKIVGEEEAARRMAESTIFEGLKANKHLPAQDVPRTLEEYMAELDRLQELLAAKGLNTKGRRELNVEIERVKFDIRKEQAKEQLQLALEEVTREAERQIADWNLFDKIRKATGNQDLAMSIAFGMNAETDYPTVVKNQFASLARSLGHDITFDTTTLEQARKLGDEIAKSWQDTASKLDKYAREQKDAIADILGEYQSLQDKLAKIDADRDRKIEVVKASTMSEPDKAALKQRINVEADYEKFTLSADYLKFFSGIYSLTMDQAQQIGDKIRLHLDGRLQAGKISAEEYYKEIERINQQLTKLRNVKSDALTFGTSGIKGLQQKKLDRADSDVLAQMSKVEQAEEELAKAKAEGNQADIAAAEQSLKLAKQGLQAYEAIRDAIVKDQESWQNVADATAIAANIAGGISDAFNTLRDLADSFGFDTDSDAWNTAAAAIDTLTTVTAGAQKVVQSAMSGDIGGIISGSFDTLLTPFTIWNKLHDRKLDRMIEKSKQAAQIMQNQYDILEKQMAHFLGNAAAMNTGTLGGGYGRQRELMQGQLAELEKQRQAELDKKKTDNSLVNDYNKQIDEMRIAIRDFAIEAASTLYGIDLNDWAEQLGDTLVDAFARGEDAGEAFDKKVGEILRSVSSKIISQDILAPMFGDLREFLFGTDGKSGAFGADFRLDPSETGAMKEYLDKIKNQGIPAAQELFDAINQATGGLLDDTEKSKSGMTAGLQSLTENTGDLIASYINAIRADVSTQRIDVETIRDILAGALPQMSVIAEAQLQAQQQIAENTLRNAIAAEAILKSSESIHRLLSRVTAGTAKFYIK